ncbi:hypothetical protein GCM10012275_24110 [Longimycelium tulufanense]|uniref:Uncharacterized protein n=1 Tax=Longimycelium tulufanense TaxID=907463 RepID=A0A8J3FVK9_9PSEU|nr:DUF6541 family protein [Longimycelium tulufanense]GGM52330.1 hypothetical protein GCM10012275_24110 [Longimycelium tulufanense]
MTLSDYLVLVAACLAFVLPGAALLLALGLRRPLWLVTLTPATSFGTALVVGTVTAPLGVPYGPLSLGAVTAAMLVVGGVRWWRARPGRIRWPRPSLITSMGFLLVLLGSAAGAAAWLRGLGRRLGTIAQEHDTIVHQVLTAYIQRTGRGAPWQSLPLDLIDGQPTQFYPAGLHLVATVVGKVAGSTVLGLNAVTVVVLGAGFALSVATLAHVAARRAGLSKQRAMLVAGIASIVSIGLYRPTFAMAHDGGLLPNAAAMVLAPGLVAGLLSLPRRDWRVAVAAGVGCAGLLAVHPTAAVTVGLTLLAWWAAELFTRTGRQRLAAQVGPLLATGGVALVVALPLLIPAATMSGAVTSFPPDIPATPLRTALEDTLGFTYGGFSPVYQGRSQVVFGGLALLGAAVLVVGRRGPGLLAAYAFWAAVTVAAFVHPGKLPASLVTGFFYHAQLRVWSHVSLLAPAIIGLGLVVAASYVAAAARNWNVVPARWVVTGAVLLFAIAYLAQPGARYAQAGARLVAARYAAPDFVRVGEDDQRAIAWLAEHVRPGQRVLNNGNDGSTFLYVEKGIPVVNVTSLGAPNLPYTYRLLQAFDRYPEDPEIRRMLLDHNVAWVYVDWNAPYIGAPPPASEWYHSTTYNLAPGLRRLDGLPGLWPAFRSGTVAVYQLDLDVVRATNGTTGASR